MRCQVVLISVLLACQSYADTGYATWFSRESARREGTSGIMANGKRLDSRGFLCALPWRPDGRQYRITNLRTGKSTIVEHADKGPGRTATGRGVVVDLTEAAFVAVGGRLEDGKVFVKVEAVNKRRKK